MLKQNLVTLLIFCTVLMLVLGTYIAIKERVAYRGRIRARLVTPNDERVASEAELTTIRQSRSLTRDGDYATPLVALNRLILQSGTRLGFPGLIAVALACAAASFSIVYFAGLSFIVGIPAAIASGIGLPVIALRAMREGRQRRFEEQLPEAINSIVRGLKAGHAISVAISSVPRHLPDPIGAEFRLAAAEMTYGLDLETAMVNLHARVGQADLGLLALAISIQSKTGGNLAEILSNMSRVIRGRFKLRRKARALAAEGRASAYILSFLPVIVFILIWLTTPSYYREVWNNFYTKPILAGAVFWMLLGDYIMYRMVRIRV